jgi:hypothetical protein
MILPRPAGHFFLDDFAALLASGNLLLGGTSPRHATSARLKTLNACAKKSTLPFLREVVFSPFLFDFYQGAS